MSVPRHSHLRLVPNPPAERPAERAAPSRAVIETLRRQITALEARDPRFAPPDPAASGDGMQPDRRGEDDALEAGIAGLARHTLGDVTVDTPASWPAAIGFALALAYRQAEGSGPVLWCQAEHLAREHGRPYGPGIADLGLDPGRLILATARRDRDVLWAMEEGLRTPGLSAVLGEVAGADFTATRRLALACAEGVATGLLLRLPDGAPSAARLRWRIAPAPAAPDPWDPRAPGRPRWRVALLRGLSGEAGEWIMEWNSETDRFHLAAALADRAAAAGADILSASG